MTRKMLHSKIMIFLIIAFIFLIPATINLPDQTQSHSIVLCVGIDKSDEEYEVSTQVLTSKTNQGFLESLQVHSARGNNILDAVEKLSLHLGRISGFGNTSCIVFSEEVAKDGIAEILDFFLRSKRLNGNPFIVITQKNAKDLLSDVAKIDESFNFSLNSLAKLNADFASSTIISLTEFLNNYYSKTTASIVSQINETDDIDDGIVVPTGSGGGEENNDSKSSNQSDNDINAKKVISNAGFSSLFVGSKQIATLSPTDIEGYSVLVLNRRNSITIKNVNDEFYHNATVVLSIKGNTLTKSLKFSKNGIPRAIYNSKYTMKVEQILQNSTDTVLLDGTKNYITKELARRIKLELKQSAAHSINLFKSYNADVYGLQQSFFKYHPILWNNFLRSIPDSTKAFQKIEFFLNIQVKGNV